MGGGFGGHMGGGFGGVHVGGGLGGIRMGGGFGHDHDRRLRFGGGDYGLYDYGCDYVYPYYNPYISSCYPSDY
jgi:hypothetical protein